MNGNPGWDHLALVVFGMDGLGKCIGSSHYCARPFRHGRRREFLFASPVRKEGLRWGGRTG